MVEQPNLACEWFNHVRYVVDCKDRRMKRELRVTCFDERYPPSS